MSDHLALVEAGKGAELRVGGCLPFQRPAFLGFVPFDAKIRGLFLAPSPSSPPVTEYNVPLVNFHAFLVSHTRELAEVLWVNLQKIVDFELGGSPTGIREPLKLADLEKAGAVPSPEFERSDTHPK